MRTATLTRGHNYVVSRNFTFPLGRAGPPFFANHVKEVAMRDRATQHAAESASDATAMTL